MITHDMLEYERMKSRLPNAPNMFEDYQKIGYESKENNNYYLQEKGKRTLNDSVTLLIITVLLEVLSVH